MSEHFYSNGKEIRIGSGPIYHTVKNKVDAEYLRLVEDVLTNGYWETTRAKIDGKNVKALSIFGAQARFNFAEGFPILTTKKVSFDALTHELVWFLSGDSNIKYLKENNVKIWDAWADENGELGYGTYGSMWRKFPWYKTWEEKNTVQDAYFESIPMIETGGVDQIKELLDNIEAVKKDPTASRGRRLIVTAWHPYYTDKVKLPPCHVLFQFKVQGNKLSLQLYQRSCDLFLGVPFNISSYCLLLSIIAHICDLRPYEFIHTYGDLHIYENHVDQLKEQMRRHGRALPELWIDPDLKNIDDFKRNHVQLLNYKHDGVLKGSVAV